MNLKQLVKRVRKVANDHSPTILTVLGVAGLVGTVVLTARATPKAMEILEEKKEENASNLETAKALAPVVAPVAISMIGTGFCIIKANRVLTKRLSNVTVAYDILKLAQGDYDEAIADLFGEKEVTKVKNKIAENHMNDAPLDYAAVQETGHGTVLCYESWGNSYFRANAEWVRKAINELNERMLHGQIDYCSLNDLYDEIGISHIREGDDRGWNINEGLVEAYFNSFVRDGEPCLAIEFTRKPDLRYDKVYR